MTEDSSAWAARRLMRACKMGTLATQDGGQPHASMVTPCIGLDGTVLMLLSELSAHTRHLRADPRCAVFFVGMAENLNPQTAPRLSVTGIAEQIEAPELKAFWVARHPYAASYADFLDFALWRVRPRAGHFVGGFAASHLLSNEQLCPPAANAAVLAASQASIVAHCNDHHAQALAALARAHGGTPGRWLLLGVDFDGVDVLQDDEVLRIAFDSPIADADGARAALLGLLA